MGIHLIPKFYFLTSGWGVHDYKLISFEYALRNAGCEKFNLVPVSSIIPPDCEKLNVEDGLKKLGTGEITFCVMSRISTELKNIPISAVISSIKEENKNHGYFLEKTDLKAEFLDVVKETIKMTVLMTDSSELKDRISDLFEDISILTDNNGIASSKGIHKIGSSKIEWQGISRCNTSKNKWLTVLSIAIFIF
jgi:arginine decarboxylase